MAVHIVDRFLRPEHHDEIVVLMDDFGKEHRIAVSVEDDDADAKVEADIAMLADLEARFEARASRKGYDVEALRAQHRGRKQELIAALEAKHGLQTSAGPRGGGR